MIIVCYINQRFVVFPVLEQFNENAERETESGPQQRNVIIGFSVTLVAMLVAVITILYCTTRRLVSQLTVITISKQLDIGTLLFKVKLNFSQNHVYNQ